MPRTPAFAVMMLTATLCRAAAFAPPKTPTLTRADVEKLVKILPRLAKESHELMADPNVALRPGGGLARLPTEDVERLEALLAGHGYTFPQFLTRLTALVATYIALEPEAFDEQLPSEESPEIRRLLDDPKVSEERKAELREQIRDAHANRELLRQQVTTSVTEENKRAVRPLLSKVRRALRAAKTESVRKK